MANLTTEERLNNLESGIVDIAEKMHNIVTDPALDDATEDLRLSINELHKRLKTLAETAETAYNILTEIEES